MNFFDENEESFLRVVGIPSVLILFIGFVLILFGQYLCISYRPKVVVFVDGSEVFRGSSACLDEKSLGSATGLEIGSGFLCLVPGFKYTSKNILIVPMDKGGL